MENRLFTHHPDNKTMELNVFLGNLINAQNNSYCEFFLFIFTEEKASETESEDDYDEQDVDEIFELDDEPIKRRSDDDDDEDDPALNPLADSSGSLI